MRRLHTKRSPMYGASKINLASMSWARGSQSSSRLHCALHLREFVLIAKQATFGLIRYGNVLRNRQKCLTNSIVTFIVMCRPNKHPRPQPASISHGRDIQQMSTRTNLARARDTLLRIYVLLPRLPPPSRNPTKNQTHTHISLPSITTRPPVLRAKLPSPTLVHPSLGSARSRATNQSHLLPRRVHVLDRRSVGRRSLL